MSLTPQRTEPLSHEELYLFDTMGFVKIPNFLSRADAESCRTELLDFPSRLMEGRGDKERFDDLVVRSKNFRDLAESEAMRGFVDPVVNQPYRLIESYALRRESQSVFYLHNGNSEVLTYGEGRSVQRNMSFSHTFHDGKLFCMFIKVLVYLTDVREPDDGPFCYLQGSHKANYPWFADPDSSGRAPALTKENFPSLDHVRAEAGDAIVLNEALLHGTLPKESQGERILMAFSYAPAFVTDWKEIDLRSPSIDKLGHY
ncbi:phytanoyl-CoA dioxygenase family protein [Streptomyces sp. NPDC059786]|uniref:phytanoyl-CoA dioxygenase family protein n=1 Tax=Streptomyces sp. NPDC059786 TaxID=3346946 RepID=UPI003646BCA7